MSISNVVGWFDIYVQNLDRARKFYESVLETKLVGLDDPSGETRMMAFDSNRDKYGASGALVQSKFAKPGVGGTMIYFSVEDCSLNELKVKSAGGKILRPKFSIGEFGFVSICEDTEGNAFGINSMK